MGKKTRMKWRRLDILESDQTSDPSPDQVYSHHSQPFLKVSTERGWLVYQTCHCSPWSPVRGVWTSASWPEPRYLTTHSYPVTPRSMSSSTCPSPCLSITTGCTTTTPPTPPASSRCSCPPCPLCRSTTWCSRRVSSSFPTITTTQSRTPPPPSLRSPALRRRSVNPSLHIQSSYQAAVVTPALRTRWENIPSASPYQDFLTSRWSDGGGRKREARRKMRLTTPVISTAQTPARKRPVTRTEDSLENSE